MGRRYRRSAVAAMGALIVPPAIALLSGAVARADNSDLTQFGPYEFAGYTEAFTYNTDTYAFDNLLSASSGYVPYELDTFYGEPGSHDFGVLFTIPLVYQGGFEDVGGAFTPISSFDSSQFLNYDEGLLLLGGNPPPLVESIDLPSIAGSSDVFSINTTTLATDNFLTGSYDLLPFDLDISYGAPDAGSFESVFTIPSLFQAGIEDISGVITPLFSINPADFVSPDLGLSLIGGA